MNIYFSLIHLLLQLSLKTPSSRPLNSGPINGIRLEFTNSQNRSSLWLKPDFGWYKLNIDGSTKDGKIAAAGVIRSHEGKWIVGFTKFLGQGTSDLSEHGLSFWD